MINLNSPTVQQMLANTPSGGMGNMPVGYGNSPTVETGIPSPHMVQISPYPDPYQMITGAGLSNYMNMPSYNFTGALSGPSYMDANQPVMGGSLPIPNYSNPYMNSGIGMSFTGMPYNPSPIPWGHNPLTAFNMNNAYMPHRDKWQKYIYATPEDRYAMDNGFHSMIDMKSNEVSIMGRLSIMAHMSNGSDEKIIDDIKESMKDKIEEIEKGHSKDGTPTTHNPFSLTNYQFNSTPVSRMHVKIVKNNKTLCEMGGKDGFSKRIPDNGMQLQSAMRHGEMIMQNIEFNKAKMHAEAPERQLDKMSLIDFFNEGFGVLRYYERQKEWEKANNVSRLFDSDEFKRGLLAQYGTPQTKRHIAREDELNFRGDGQKEQDMANGLIRGTYGFMPNGMPLSPGVNPNLGSAISIDTNTGGLRIQLPPELDNDPVSNRYVQRAYSARERFIASIGRD